MELACVAVGVIPATRRLGSRSFECVKTDRKWFQHTQLFSRRRSVPAAKGETVGTDARRDSQALISEGVPARTRNYWRTPPDTFTVAGLLGWRGKRKAAAQVTS